MGTPLDGDRQQAIKHTRGKFGEKRQRSGTFPFFKVMRRDAGKRAVLQEPGNGHLRSPDDPGVRAAREDEGWSKTKIVAAESPVRAVGSGPGQGRKHDFSKSGRLAGRFSACRLQLSIFLKSARSPEGLSLPGCEQHLFEYINHDAC